MIHSAESLEVFRFSLVPVMTLIKLCSLGLVEVSVSALAVPEDKRNLLTSSFMV